MQLQYLHKGKSTTANCSLLSPESLTSYQKGYLFAVPEKPSDFKVKAGEGVLKTYSFGNGIAEHKVRTTS